MSVVIKIPSQCVFVLYIYFFITGMHYMTPFPVEKCIRAHNVKHGTATAKNVYFKHCHILTYIQGN